MTVGGSLLLIAIGAILKWAVTAHVSWIDLQTAGTVIFVVGLAGLVVSLFYTFYWSQREPAAVDDPARRTQQPPPRSGGPPNY